jgi:hypothetical protein
MPKVGDPVAHLVPLPDVPQEVKHRRAVDDRTAQDLVREAFRLGELKFIIRRPDGSFEALSPRSVLWDEGWRRMFDDGIIDAPYRMPGSRRRGLPWSEPCCRVYVTRKSLNAFPGPRSRGSAKRPIDKDVEKFVAGYIKKTNDEGKTPTKRGLCEAARDGLPGATRPRLHAEFERQSPTPNPGRPRKKRQQMR